MVRQAHASTRPLVIGGEGESVQNINDNDDTAEICSVHSVGGTIVSVTIYD
jgi:hypothetical protein